MSKTSIMKKSRTANSEWVLPDPGKQSEPSPTTLEQVDNQKPCVFKSKVIKIPIGTPETRFHVHKDILLKAGGKLAACVNPDLWDERVDFPDLEPRVFELVLEYLYGGCYKTYSSDTVLKTLADCEIETNFDRACSLYCFAMEYGIHALRGVTQNDIETSDIDNYEAILSAAKRVYGSTFEVEPWFHDYIVAHTKRALNESHIATLPWFLDVFCGSYRNLGSIIFEVFRDMCSELLTLESNSTEKASLTESIESLSSVDDEVASVARVQVSETSAAESPLVEGAFVMTTSLHSESTFITPEEVQLEEQDPWSFWGISNSMKEKKKKKKKSCGVGGTEEHATEQQEPILKLKPWPELEYCRVGVATGDTKEEPIVDNIEPDVDSAHAELQHPDPKPAAAWDYGLTAKEKRKKRRNMEAEGIIFDSSGEPMESGAMPNTDKPVPEPEPEPSWDFGLNAKEKKKRRKEMEAQGIEFDWLGEPIYPKAECTINAPNLEPELEPEPVPEVPEPELSWDFGLNAKEKKKRRKEMEAQGIEFDWRGEPIIFEAKYTANEPEQDLAMSWDHGLSAKEKKKKRKQMEADGIKFDAFGDPVHSEPHQASVEAEVEVELMEVQETESFSETNLSQPEMESIISAESIQDFTESQHKTGASDVVIAFEIAYDDSVHRLIRKRVIEDWKSFTDAVLDCIFTSWDELLDHKKFWLSDLWVKLHGEIYCIQEDFEETILHVLKNGSAKRDVVNIGMTIYTSVDGHGGKEICID